MALLMTVLMALGETDRRLETRISVDFRDATLADAIETVREATGLNFVVQEGADVRVRLVLKDVTAKSVLHLLLKPLGLCEVYEDGVVVIRHCRKEATTLRVYDVRGAMTRIQDYPGVDLDQNQGSCCLLVVLPSPEEAPTAHPLAEQLVSLIQAHCGDRGLWEGNRGASVSLVNGLLLVRQTREGHRRVEEFLKGFGL